MGAIFAAFMSLVGSLSSSRDKRKQRNAVEEQLRYQASSSYASTVRSIELTREQRQLERGMAEDHGEFSQEIKDLSSEMTTALENADLVRGSGPILKEIPVEKILIPVLMAYLATVVFKE